MGSLHNSSAEMTDCRTYPNDDENDFRRKIFNQNRFFIPRRYVLCIMIFLVISAEVWRMDNIMILLIDAMYSVEGDIVYHAVENRTFDDFWIFNEGFLVAEIFVQMPAAFLIYFTSSYKFLMVSGTLLSILHVLTPVALNHHTWILVVVIIGQRLLLLPVKIAALSMWKHWAPPSERTKLLTLSLSGVYLIHIISEISQFYMNQYSIPNSFYILGICGFVWSLFWYVAISPTPNNDPLISEREFIYLQNTIPDITDEPSKFSEIPWKLILTSKPLWILLFIHWKTPFTMSAVIITANVAERVSITQDIDSPAIYISITTILILIIGAIGGDFLTRKFKKHTLNIKKIAICGAFTLQSILSLGTLFSSYFIKIIFAYLSFAIFLFSVPGFITIALDLSSRYITIIAGMIETFHCVGWLCSNYWLPLSIHWTHDGIVGVFLLDGLVSILIAVMFYRWGAAEEQAWSRTCRITPKFTDYHRFPRPEDDNETLVNDIL